MSIVYLPCGILFEEKIKFYGDILILSSEYQFQLYLVLPKNIISRDTESDKIVWNLSYFFFSYLQICHKNQCLSCVNSFAKPTCLAFSQHLFALLALVTKQIWNLFVLLLTASPIFKVCNGKREIAQYL